MNEINLLPQELKANSKVVALASSLKKISLLFSLILLFATVLSLGTFILFQQRVNTTLSNQENLKSQIKALENTEQRLVLVKDRLKKINTITRQPRANDEVSRLDKVTKFFPENVEVKSVLLEEDKANLAVSSDNLTLITQYLASVISSGDFDKITLLSLEFKPDSGYVVELSFLE